MIKELTLALIVAPTISGVRNTNVTQSNISVTICKSGFTASIRPSDQFTTALKIKQIKALGYKDTDPSHYEEDHFIPLELGGSPKSPKNLWPEPWAQAHKSDPVENATKRKVCSGVLTLAEGRKFIISFKRKYG